MGHVAREVEEVHQERRRRLVGLDDRGAVFGLGGPVGIFHTFLEVLRELLRLLLLVLGEACVMMRSRTRASDDEAMCLYSGSLGWLIQSLGSRQLHVVGVSRPRTRLPVVDVVLGICLKMTATLRGTLGHV